MRSVSRIQRILQWGHRRKINRTDLRLLSGVLLAALMIHLIYTLPHHGHVHTRMAEALLNYQHGRYPEALRLCQRDPRQPVSLWIQANLRMLSEQPAQAEPLYRQALTQEPGSPSALLGLALALQMNGQFTEAAQRYNDFIEIHGTQEPEAAQLAEQLLRLTQEKISHPPDWRRMYARPMMNDLGL